MWGRRERGRGDSKQEKEQEGWGEQKAAQARVEGVRGLGGPAAHCQADTEERWEGRARMNEPEAEMRGGHRREARA